MRVFFTTLATATALLLTACSGGTEGSTLQRGRSAEASGSPAATSPSGSGDSTASPTSASTPAPATQPAADTAPAASDAGAATTPAPTNAAPGSCGNPKCLGGNGLGGCKATDSAGDVVTMGCQDGACGCFAGGQNTAAFAGDVNSADDAAQLFLANCTCN